MTYLKSLTLCNFRNYVEQTVNLCPKINIFVGKNGQGKTNCLEAIALFIAGKSFRSPYLKDLIRHNESNFFLHSTFVKNDIEQSLSIDYSPQKKTIFYNATSYNSFLPLIGILQGVFFAGFYDELIKGSPQIRRRFIDLQSAQVDPLYIHHLTHFQKALKERNFLLKSKTLSSLEIYEEIMSKSIPYILSKRTQSLLNLQHHAQKIHEELSGLNEEIKLKYKTSFIGENSQVCSREKCLTMLKQNRTRDLHFGYTLAGPHKDELGIYLKDQSAKKFGSEGQIQTLMTAIYLAEYFRLKESVQEAPLFCIDDLGQNLDSYRQQKLLTKLEEMGQIFITTPQEPKHKFNCETQIFHVENGKIYAA
ncbi:MAG: DNA replication and repair protein RecF [Chlamydiae bacterium]|nr:DNA replication and repair protein RecF [Chlamydiota bacterium]